MYVHLAVNVICLLRKRDNQACVSLCLHKRGTRRLLCSQKNCDFFRCESTKSGCFQRAKSICLLRRRDMLATRAWKKREPNGRPALSKFVVGFSFLFGFHTVFVTFFGAGRTFAGFPFEHLVHTLDHLAHFIFDGGDDSVRADGSEGADNEFAAVLFLRFFFFTFGK